MFQGIKRGELVSKSSSAQSAINKLIYWNKCWLKQVNVKFNRPRWTVATLAGPNALEWVAAPSGVSKCKQFWLSEAKGNRSSINCPISSHINPSPSICSAWDMRGMDGDGGQLFNLHVTIICVRFANPMKASLQHKASLLRDATWTLPSWDLRLNNPDRVNWTVANEDDHPFPCDYSTEASNCPLFRSPSVHSNTQQYFREPCGQRVQRNA